MYHYSAHGLNFQSEICFRSPPGDNHIDVAIHYDRIGYLPENRHGQDRFFQKTADGVLLSWRNVGQFLVKDGEEIVVQPMAGVDDELIRQVIFGPVLGVLLGLRGLSVFHASAVAFPEGAGIFLAPKGHGKSTLATALHLRGHSFITDDIAALRLDGHKTVVMPGTPQLKLWPDVINCGKDSTIFRISAGLDKRSYSLERIVQEPTIPRCAYILGPEIRSRLSLGSKEALIEWLPLVRSAISWRVAPYYRE
jgi:hypothetical protein